MKRLLVIASVLLLSVLGFGVSAQDEVRMPARLLLADTTGTVHVFDTATGEVLTSYPIAEETLRLYKTPGGERVVVFARRAGQIRAIDSGVRVGRDGSVTLEDAALLDWSLNVDLPTHFVMHDGMMASFNDGDGTVSLFEESALTSAAPQVTTFNTERAHHGVAVPFAGHMLVTQPDPHDADAILPLGVEVMTMDDELVAGFYTCPGLHGEATIGNSMAVFGCSDSVLVIERDRETGLIGAYNINNPDRSDSRVGTVAYNEASGIMIGNYAADTYVIIDLEQQEMDKVELPLNIWLFPQFLPSDGTKLVALTHDGALHIADALTGSVEMSLPVIAPYVPPAQRGEGAPRPALALSGDMGFISDLTTGELVAIDLRTMSEVARYDLGVAITSMAAFGA
jgi:hypothetical protein